MEIFFSINFTHIIRICPKMLQFLTYNIYYITLKYPKLPLVLTDFHPFLRPYTPEGNSDGMKSHSIFAIDHHGAKFVARVAQG